MSKYPVIIGRFEKIDVIDLVDNIPAKIDTGAYGSSIHATNIKIVQKNNKEYLQFTILGHLAHGTKRVVKKKNFTTTKVRSSNGHISERYEVKLRIRLGYKVFLTSFTLTNRSGNVFPVLVGRKALNGRFLVDPSKTGVTKRQLEKVLKEIPLEEENVDKMEGVNV